jgi:hypothetical protein
MEKQRTKSKYRLFSRLLIILFFVLSSNFAFAQSFREKINSLEISPVANQNFYTKTEIKFEVDIPEVSPNVVQVRNTSLPENVYLKSMRKYENFENGYATKLEFWLTFDQVGVYKFQKMQVLINGRNYYIRVANVEIEENPENLNPRVVVVFKDGTQLYSDGFYSSKYYSEKENKAISVFDAKIGQKLEFTVYLQYGVQLIQFDWELPKNSIFTQTEQFEITEIKYRENKFSKELIPVASFEWTGLVEEKMAFPKIKLIATGYKGYKNEIIFPSYEINFVKNDSDIKKTSEVNIFDDAFSFDKTLVGNFDSQLVTDEIAQNIANLRIQERNATLDYFKVVNKRIETESFFGFASSKKEFPVKILYVLAFLIVLFFVVLLLGIKRKKRSSIIFSSVVLVILLVANAFCIFQASKKYGICVGGILQSVPEESASSKFEIASGNRVLISQQFGDWLFIEYGDVSGWIKKENIILIK